MPQPDISGGFQSILRAISTASLVVRLRNLETVRGPVKHRASLVVWKVKNPLATQETWVPSLGAEVHLEKGVSMHSSNLA